MDTLCQPVDMMPTVLDLAGVSLPDGLHGRSLLPVLRGQTDAVRELAFSSPTLSPSKGRAVYTTITDGEWTLLYPGEMRPAEFYYLPTDLGQANNVIEHNRARAVAMHAAYVAFLERIGADEARLEVRRELV